MQAIWQKEFENDRRKDEAVARIPKWEEEYRGENKQGFQQFKWIIDFLLHFFDTFKEIPKDVKEKLTYLIFSIEENYSQNESQIDDITKCAKDGVDQYTGEN